MELNNMLYDVHIAELKPKESYELRIDRFTYHLNHSQLIDLHNSILTLLKEGEPTTPAGPGKADQQGQV